MKKSYFTVDDDFETIIRNSLPDKKINSISTITTGWTNIVFEVATNNGDFFFRFPRDDFWSRTIVKDYEFCKFIDNKLDYKTVKLNLLYDNERPFTMHKKIEGIILVDKMNDMTSEQIKIFSQDIAKFLVQLHNLKFNQEEIFKTSNIGLKLPEFLDELLNVHVDEKDKVFWKYEENSKKCNGQLVHGDLNSSNIILDDNCNVYAIIDFGFAGFGNKYDDISRIIGRCPENLRDKIIKSYEELSNEKLDNIVLDNEIGIWNNIDNAYINYMRKIGIYK